jgi:hypothetical protein
MERISFCRFLQERYGGTSVSPLSFASRLLSARDDGILMALDAV